MVYRLLYLFVPLTMLLAYVQPTLPIYRSHEDRITELEAQMDERERADKAIEQHFTQHVDDILRSQGIQDQEIRTLEQRQAVVYFGGQLAAWLASVLITIILVFSNRKYKEGQRRHLAIEGSFREVNERLDTIEKQLVSMIASARAEADIRRSGYVALPSLPSNLDL